MDFQPLVTTFKLALTTTIVLFIISLPLSYYLAYSKTKLKPVFETIVSLPLILPPTVLGFYFLIFLGLNSPLGMWLNQTFNLKMVFTFHGLVFASVIYSLPFMIHPIQSALSSLPKTYLENCFLFDKSKFSTLIYVLLPNIKPALLTGIVLTFAHTIGEFGMVLIIGGNIPGKTQVASTIIYNNIESMEYDLANQYATILLIVSVLILLAVYILNRNHQKKIV